MAALQGNVVFFMHNHMVETVYFLLIWRQRGIARGMKSILIKDTTREERMQIIHQSLWGSCGLECEFCSGCDSLGGGRAEDIYQPYIDGLKEISEINDSYCAPMVRG